MAALPLMMEMKENYGDDDPNHIRPFTEHEGAEEGEAPVVAEGNDDREVENETLRMDIKVKGYKLNNQQ